MKSAIIEAAEYIEALVVLSPAQDSSRVRRYHVDLAQRLRAEAKQPIRLGPDRWAKEARFRPESSSPAIPDGWRLVPVEPTYEMQRALHGIYGEARRRWSAALALAPAPPASEDSPSVEKSSVIRAPQRGGG